MDLSLNDEQWLGRLKWDAAGLVPAIIQDANDGAVLMMAWMDETALRATIATGETHFYSRSRRAQWRKGETSGHVQKVHSIHLDCDGDTLLVRVDQVGGACHEGHRSCFFRELRDGDWQVAGQRVFDPGTIYPLPKSIP